ncbi:arylsulfatase [Shimia aestuarii]|uniref:Arylsulfatase n=1 Tax=Shimia aestuarii TaxID=254406 RepID=A0A1I4Q4Y1_9RHOB|nr:arylsulfatase [Shimia aestuarii]SFM35084.1 arylsulfatase [Shimia aestuarii]
MTNASDFEGSITRYAADSQPWWPERKRPRAGSPNILVVLFDDVGFSDFGCYGSSIRTPVIDRLASNGLRYTGFHTTAMCSTTRAAMLTGRNHHSVGMGCLANFDSGYPGYRGKISREAGTIAEILRPSGYRNYMVGKWHVTPLTESGATGPFDGWPLGRGFDRFYGFLDAETDQYSPELVRDNGHIDPPGTFETGYHLTEDLFDNAIGFIANHIAELPDTPWMTFIAPGACHAPHQAPFDLIKSYHDDFIHGWDVERDRRLARQKQMGIVPKATDLPDRNPGVQAWRAHSPDEQAVFSRLNAAYAAMLEHTDQNLGRLIDFLEAAGQLDNTITIVLSDNGASQEGGPLGFVNAMGPYNGLEEDVAKKLARIDAIGGPDTHSNFPWGWAMTSNTPLRRYKQNTHGGGVRDPLVVHWPAGLKARGELRHQFAHVSDLVPTLLDVLGIEGPNQIGDVPQMPFEGESFAASFHNAKTPARSRPQYFEMFGHRGLWADGWKAVSYHAPGTPFEEDEWELYNLDQDFSEVHDLADQEPERLKAMIDLWWKEAEACKVLPLDDRFAERFAENSVRFQGHRTEFVFHRGVGHVPTDVAPDVRARNYAIEADASIPEGGAEGVLIAHGDATSGYSLYLRDSHLCYSINIGGSVTTINSDRPVPTGDVSLGLRATVEPGLPHRDFELLINGEPAGAGRSPRGFAILISWSGLDIGRDRGTTVVDYPGPFEFTGFLRKVTVRLEKQDKMDSAAMSKVEIARQ